VASKSNRQRKLERERAERRLARQAQRARRRRQIQAGVGGGLALILIVVGATWIFGGFDPDPPAAEAAPTCVWTPRDTTASPNLTDVGMPPASGELRSGFEQLNIKTNLGDISALVDLSKVPCTAASFKHLGEQNFFAGSTCHRLSTPSMILTCGDPRSDGTGGPTYQFADENLPTEPVPAPTPDPTASATPAATTSYYAKGTLIMANSGPNTNGSQFSIVYGDGSDLPPSYTVVGTLTTGLDIVEGVAQAGAIDPNGQPAPDGKPNTALTIEQLYLGSTPPPASAPATSEPAPAPTATATPTPSPSQ
jgi:peptidyl-prolyl cis-trans isomerase B (cyclophilin B)